MIFSRQLSAKFLVATGNRLIFAADPICQSIGPPLAELRDVQSASARERQRDLLGVSALQALVPGSLVQRTPKQPSWWSND